MVRDTIETGKQRFPDFLIWLGGKLIAPMASSRLFLEIIPIKLGCCELFHLALAGLEKDPIRADFLQRHSLDPLPNDPNCHQRAGEVGLCALLFWAEIDEPA